MTLRKNLPALLFFLLAFGLQAEQLASPTWGYALDLPEGYQLVNSRGSDRYLFTHGLVPLDLQIALYPPDAHKSASAALKAVTDQLGAQDSAAVFQWRFREAALSQVHFTAGEQRSGWALSLTLESNKGYLVMICSAKADQAVALEPFIISTLDAVYTDEGSWRESGPMTSFGWQRGEGATAEFTAANTTLRLPFNSIDSEANCALVEREFQVLSAYAQSSLAVPAWQRYYRLIWRDAWKRFSAASFMIYNELAINGQLDNAALAAALLSWTQEFSYERDFSGSDFVNLPEAFAYRKGDCDSRALLLVLMLNQMGIDAILLVSPVHSHAVAAIDISGEGARFMHGDKGYLIADTTSKEKAGRIAADMADPADWFAVDFPVNLSQ